MYTTLELYHGQKSFFDKALVSIFCFLGRQQYVVFLLCTNIKKDVKTKNHGQLHIVKRTRKRSLPNQPILDTFQTICTSWFALLNLKEDKHDPQIITKKMHFEVTVSFKSQQVLISAQTFSKSFASYFQFPQQTSRSLSL